MVHAIYVLGLPSGFSLVEVAKVLCGDLGSDKVTDGAVHNANACFLICADAQTGESIVQIYQGKLVFQVVGQVSS